MAGQPHSSPSTRRALLSAGLGALAATVASALGRPVPARAGSDGDVVLGVYNEASGTTVIANTAGEAFMASSSSGAGLHGASGSGEGVYGFSYSFIGVHGFSASTNQPATVGQSSSNSTGLLGYSGTGSTLPAAKAKTGIYGQATQDSSSRGVWGKANAGHGVRGEATSGAGLFGTATTGFAIRGDGRLKFDKVSGTATIPAGAKQVVVIPGVSVTATSFVLLTPKANIGSRALWFTLDTANNKLTIKMSSPRTSGTAVAWLLVG